MSHIVIKIEWPLEADECFTLALEKAQEKFPDLFEGSDWTDQICQVTKLPLLDLLESAEVGDVMSCQFCEVTVVVDQYRRSNFPE